MNGVVHKEGVYRNIGTAIWKTKAENLCAIIYEDLLTNSNNGQLMVGEGMNVESYACRPKN